MMKTPYEKPKRFSDPHSDFSQEEIDQALNCSEQDIGYYELSRIFQEFLPIGTYEECAYYIPHALDFMKTNIEERADIVGDFICWCCANKEELERDLLLDEILNHIEAVFKEAVDSCTFVRNIDGFPYPNNQSFISFTLEALYECPYFKRYARIWIDSYCRCCGKWERCELCVSDLMDRLVAPSIMENRD